MTDILHRISGIEPKSDLAEAMAKRAEIFRLTQQSHDAVLTPADPGGLSHAERAAFACRIAELNEAADFATHFAAMLEDGRASGADARIADPGFDGADDARLRALIRHVDLIAMDPKSARAGDIDLLRAAGISEPDIVRLSELVAFLTYQLRVAAGLRLMGAL